MSQRRQSAIFERLRDRHSEVRTLTRDYPAGHVIPLHYHDVAQLVFASRGVMTVRTANGTWVVPTQRAVWIPVKVAHSVSMSGLVAMRTLYVRPRLARTLPRECCVVNVSPLLKELILHACGASRLSREIDWQRHLIDMIVDQFETLQMVPLQLPHPSDARAMRIAKMLLENPSDRRELAQICKTAGASKRTVERIFQEDVGMSFGKWRQQVRLMEGMRLLAAGAKVTHAALESGYSTASAFIAMFRKTLRMTPAKIFGTGRREVPGKKT